MVVTRMQDSYRPAVVLADGVVHIDGFLETDPDVVRAVGDATDPEAATHKLLQIGARATLSASVSIETSIVEHRFDGMANRFDQQLGKIVGSINETAEQLLGEDDGALAKILTDLRKDITVALDGTFDEDSKTSAIGKIDRVITEAVEQLDRRVRQTLDPHAADSPMAKTKRELIEVVKEQTGAILAEVKDISLAMVGHAARADVETRTTAKGFAYEDLVQADLGRVAAIHGDLVEHVGRSIGAAGTQRGDHLVRVCAEDTCGMDASFVLEAKDRKLSLSKTMQELDAALANHGALAAVAVFSSQGVAPTTVPFQWWGNKAIVVVDKDGADPRALHLAYAWARWVVRRSISADEETELDLGRVEAALTAARRALARHQTVKACHSAARKKIEESALHVADLVDEVDEALKVLWDELSR